MSAHQLPVRCATMPAFGGDDMKTLFVTTAYDKNTKTGGELYSLHAQTPGIPNTQFDPQA